MNFDYYLIDTKQAVIDLFNAMHEAGMKKLAVDTEGTGLNTTKGYDYICGVSVSCDGEQGFYIPVRHEIGTNVDPEWFFPYLGEQLHKFELTYWVNGKYDLAMLYNEGIDYWDLKIFDAMVADFVYDCSDTQRGLKYLAIKRLGHVMVEYDEVTNGKRFHQLNPEEGYEYAGDDAVQTFRLGDWYENHPAWSDCERIFDIEMGTLKAVIDLERTRIRVDVDKLDELEVKYVEETAKLKQKIIDITGVKNPNSNKQMREYFFEPNEEGKVRYIYKRKKWKLTKTKQFKMSAEIKEEMAEEGDEIAVLLCEYDKKRKMGSTYITPLKKNRYPDDTVKLNLKQTGARTGRFSAPGGNGMTGTKKKSADGYSGLNNQTWPRRTDFGEVFIPRPGKVFLAPDWDAQESVIITNHTGEPAMVEALLAGKDPHKAMVNLALGTPIEDVKKWQRGIGKELNFAIVYGAAPETIGRRINARLPKGEPKYDGRKAGDLLDEFFRRAPATKAWVDQRKEQCMMKSCNYMTYTALGRTRQNAVIKMLVSRGLNPRTCLGRTERSEWERISTNTPIQGCAADLGKIALYRIAKYCRTFRNALLINMIHDEFILEVDDDPKVIAEVSSAVEEIMKLTDILSEELKWVVPLKATAEVKYNLRKAD